MKLNKKTMAFLSAAVMGILSVGCGEGNSPDSSVEAPTIPIEPSTILEQETTTAEISTNTTGIATVLATAPTLAVTSTTETEALPEITTTAAEKAVVTETTYLGYSDRIAFIVDSMQIGWTGLAEPSDFNLSSIYKDNFGQADFGFVRIDLDGDGIDELLIGETTADGQTVFYDIFTVIGENSMVSLASGGEKQRYYIDTNNNIVCEGTLGAAESSVDCYQLKDGKLMIVSGYSADAAAPYQPFTLDLFSNYVNNNQQ